MTAHQPQSAGVDRAPLLELLADARGPRATFEVIARLPVLALALIFARPRSNPAASPSLAS